MEGTRHLSTCVVLIHQDADCSDAISLSGRLFSLVSRPNYAGTPPRYTYSARIAQANILGRSEKLHTLVNKVIR